MPSTPPISLERLPRTSASHMWADYIELLCLVNLDRTISKADVLDRVRDRRDLRESSDLPSDENDDEAFQEGKDENGITSTEGASSPAGLNDSRALQVDDWFKHLEYRWGAFKDFYPFMLSSEGNALYRRKRMTLKHKLYTFFLLSSNLMYIKNKRQRNRLTSSFEIASLAALRSYLPHSAKTYIFGKNSLYKGRYGVGSLWNKIGRLAEDIREKVVCREDDFEPTDTGDNGLDVVGWIPAGDDAQSFLLMFGQCACTLEWVNKQFTSSAVYWRSTMSFTAPPTNMAFIPFCFRRPTGAWHKHRQIHESILIDRLRFVRLLQDRYRWLAGLPHDLVDQVHSQRESLV